MNGLREVILKKCSDVKDEACRALGPRDDWEEFPEEHGKYVAAQEIQIAVMNFKEPEFLRSVGEDEISTPIKQPRDPKVGEAVARLKEAAAHSKRLFPDDPEFPADIETVLSALEGGEQP